MVRTTPTNAADGRGETLEASHSEGSNRGAIPALQNSAPMATADEIQRDVGSNRGLATNETIRSGLFGFKGVQIERQPAFNRTAASGRTTRSACPARLGV